MNIVNMDALSVAKMIVLGAIGVLAWQTFNIQVLNREVYQAETKSMVTRTKSIYAERGEILDRNGVVFAKNLRDTGKAEDYTRIFLQGKLASQIVGKVGYDGEGSMGMERMYDLRLRGNEGFRVGIKDAKEREILGRSENVAEAKPGKNLVLTIDRNMQEIVEKALKDGVNEFSAASASAVVVDPYTGEILAMASYPTFDPNSKKQGVGKMAKNDIVAMSFEPGSTFKVITAAAALENGSVPEDTVFANEGKCWSWSARAERICDTHIYGDMDMAEGMVQSSNIVFAKVADKVGAEKLYRMARNFGFGMKTSENLAGEEAGRLYMPYELTRDDRTLKTMGFGHAVSVTPIQMVMAYAAIANGGTLMEPMIVKEWRDSDGNLVEKKEPVKVRRVISERTAASIRKMLNRVVNSGTAKRVASKKIPDVIFGGKTGTAEKYNQETGKYDREHQVASFIGLAPVEDVRYVCMVLVDDPNADKLYGHTGGATAGPIFRRIMEGIYYHPKLSPASHDLAFVKGKSPCEGDYVGMLAQTAKSVAANKKCPVIFEGEGSRVLAVRRDLTDSIALVLKLGDVDASTMPDLKGLTLKDALEIAGNIRINVEYTGMGRVVSQTPKVGETLHKGQICKLTLKERG
ncbi:penicillin-binding protein [Fibrobacter sp. UWB10]|uniref:penicillin-binding protein n=1 Tax=Fibrobacter sp. UWB10 TaxID=1896201 RepID=UPI001B1588D9|nr:penicillin-binding protein [Fibrobacter sp. UWB10]MBO7512636.1 transpeptidase family protein [Fibrobacter sp.]SMP44533.1 cell division protein FtsI (penicillin-binding protein 3)/stage V sporulation protein D (sporulation-specific penicillin-binding protein) [Fibrobacter sp. UWB10]